MMTWAASLAELSLTRIDEVNDESIRIVQMVAERIIETEHVFFVVNTLDNSEHVPRVGRIARSVADFLRQQNVNRRKCEDVAKDLVDYGRRLFVHEWMFPSLDIDFPDDEEPREEDAVKEFNRILKQSRHNAAEGRF